MSKPYIASVRTLTPPNRIKVRRLFQQMLDRSQMGLSADQMYGEFFALIHHARVVAGIWIRAWPGKPRTGDVHIAASKFRFRDYDSIVAFDLLLRQRADIMALDEWQVAVSVEDAHVIRALEYLKFTQVSRQAFPGMGEMVIMLREVV